MEFETGRKTSRLPPAVIAGEDAWKWQQKGTLVWAQTKTEQQAIQAIEADAQAVE